MSNSVICQDFKLTCSETDTSLKIGLSSRFSKIVNFEKKTLFNYSGGYFDDVILFGTNEIILDNRVFKTRSTFNISRNKWISYKGQFVKLYSCTKEKRRF